MKTTQSPHYDRQDDLFRSELFQVIDTRYPLVKLAKAVNWDRRDKLFGSTFCPDQGCPTISTRR